LAIITADTDSLENA